MNDGLKNLQEEGCKWVEANRSKRFSGVTKLLTDLYPDNAHFIYELLQNAEDARDKSRHNSCGASVVRFTLNKDSLEFEHDGEGLFHLTDVESITGIGDSNKAQDPTSIGKFGVGFKAVFAYTNTPEIHSGDYHFRIRDLVVPEPVTPCQIDERVTKFIFPFNHSKKSASQAEAEIANGLQKLGDNTLLFLKHIRKVEYLLPNGSLGSLERIDQSGGYIEIRACHPSGDESISHWLRFEKDVDVTDEDGKLKTCRIAIAYSLTEEDRKKKQSKWKIDPLDHGQVSIYFPAEKETSNLRFHIHAPFASTVARDSVRDCKANQDLRDHLAELVVESLTTIRDAGMLDVSFLTVLPNPADNLPEFYEPIREAIVEAFREQDLTPTRSGEHRSAGALYRGPATIADVIRDDGLSNLTSFSVPLWAANAPQENQREDRFIQSLEIEEWSWSELASIFKLPHPYAGQDNEKAENASHKERIETFIRQMSDAELMRFYALLGEAVDAHNVHINRKYVDNLCIVRVTNDNGNNHVTPKETYFQPEGEEVPPSDVIFVKPEVYSAGRSDSQKKFAASFLKTIGVRPYDAKAGVERILGEYRIGHVPSPKTHISHIRQFVGHWLDNPNSIEMFKPIAFLIGEGRDGVKTYCKTSDLYLDSPYSDTGLAALFNDNKLGESISKPKKRLHPDYQVIKKFEEFAVALGAMKQLEICVYDATKMQSEVFEKVGRKSDSTTNEDYYINGLRWRTEGSVGFIGNFNLGRHKSMALSCAIWSAMCGTGPKVLTARYVPNKRNIHKEKSKSSFLVDYLAEHSWVPDKDGNFRRPTEITDKTLHPDFKFDDRNGWLTAIRFGEDDRKQSAEYRAKDEDAKRLGLPSVDVAEEVGAYFKTGGSMEEFRTLMSNRKQVRQPECPVPNAERRRRGIIERQENAPTRESVIRERSIQPGSNKETLEAKAYLREMYQNLDNLLICQCCQREMPFKLKSDLHYFEAIQCVRGLDKHLFENHLALCPICAAMYQHARETDDAEIRRSIVEHEADDKAPAVEIPVRLAGRELTLRFVGKHWFDLKTVLSQ